MNFFQSRTSFIISLLSVLFAFFLLFVMAGDNRIKDFLNDKMSKSIVSRPYEEMQTILPEYFNYLLGAAFWVEAGEFPAGFSHSNLDLLHRSILRSLPGVEALNLYNGDLCQSFMVKQDKVVSKNFIAKEPADERIRLERTNLTNDGSDLREEIFLSPIHQLESTGELGFSIMIEIEDAPLSAISLDISLFHFSRFYQEIFGENAILFSAFGGDDSITIPLNNDLQKDPFYDELTKTALERIGKNSSDRPLLIDYGESKWFVLFYEPDEYGAVMGFILPESELFFSQFDRLYIWGAIPFLLLFLILITLFFSSVVREKKSLSEEDLLLRMVEKGECATLEFKSSLRWDYRENHLNKKLEEVILKSIAAFANGAGGVLLIGVDDDGTPLGLEPDYKTLKHPDKDCFELHLRNLVSSMYGTFAIRNMDVAFIRIRSKDICKVSIRSSSSPLFTLMRGKNGDRQEQFFIRDGNMSRRIESLKDITDYCRNRFQ